MTSLAAVHDSPRRHQRPRFHYQVPVRLWRREQATGQIRPHRELQAFLRRLRQHALRPDRQAPILLYRGRPVRVQLGNESGADGIATPPTSTDTTALGQRPRGEPVKARLILTPAPRNESEAADPPTGTTAATREKFTPSPDYHFERGARK